jgi:hypothetical protein
LVNVILFPVILITKNGRKMLKNIFSVLAGAKTWVSYVGSESAKNLPKIKAGVFKPIEAYPNSQFEPTVNLAYARDYAPHKDSFILMKILFR